MDSNNNNKLGFIIGILLIVALTVIIYFAFFNSTDTPQVNTINNEFVSDKSGPTDITCSSNVDCENICKDDGCLISSCVKGQSGETGKCACFDLCGL